MMDLTKYIDSKRQKGAYLEKGFDKYASPPKQEPAIIDGVSTVVSKIDTPQSTSKANLPQSDFDKIALPVLTSWIKGVGGLESISKRNDWGGDKTGGVTALEYFRRAKKFDDPSLPLSERLTQMIYGVETSGNPNSWKKVNNYGYMGRAQIGEAFMKDYGIDKSKYMSDPVYQHQQTVNAVSRRIKELKGKYY